MITQEHTKPPQTRTSVKRQDDRIVVKSELMFRHADNRGQG